MLFQEIQGLKKSWSIWEMQIFVLIFNKSQHQLFEIDRFSAFALEGILDEKDW